MQLSWTVKIFLFWQGQFGLDIPQVESQLTLRAVLSTLLLLLPPPFQGGLLQLEYYIISYLEGVKLSKSSASAACSIIGECLYLCQSLLKVVLHSFPGKCNLSLVMLPVWNHKKTFFTSRVAIHKWDALWIWVTSSGKVSTAVVKGIVLAFNCL